MRTLPVYEPLGGFLDVFAHSTTVGSLAGETHTRSFFVAFASVVVFVAVCLSAFLVVDHLTSYSKPEEQKWIVGILFMVPIYSLDSLLSLWDTNLSVLCNAIREGYEAYTIYCFGRFLIACLGGEQRVIEKLEGQGGQAPGPHTPLLQAGSTHAAAMYYDGRPLGHRAERQGEVTHPFIMSWIFDPWVLGHHFYQGVKFGIVQYMIVKTVGAVAALILQLAGIYNDGDFSLTSGYLYISLAINFSQFWAMYCLVQFGIAMHEFLRPIKPVGKFMCIKAVVFLTWWQGFTLAALYSFDILKPPSGTTSDKFQSDVQNFLICMEMAGAAVFHYHAFPTEPYRGEANHMHAGRISLLTNCAAMDAPPDPNEVVESERPAIVKYVPKDLRREAPTLSMLGASVHDVLFAGGATVVDDVQTTMSQATEPIEKTFHRIRGSFQDKVDQIGAFAEALKGRISPSSRDDLQTATDTEGGRVRPIRGIDDPFLTGSVSDSGYAIDRRARSSAYHSGGPSRRVGEGSERIPRAGQFRGDGEQSRGGSGRGRGKERLR